MIIIQRMLTTTNTASCTAAAKPGMTAEIGKIFSRKIVLKEFSRKIVLKEIGSKWSKVSEYDLSALKQVTTISRPTSQQSVALRRA